jgi:hypothetical protein
MWARRNLVHGLSVRRGGIRGRLEASASVCVPMQGGAHCDYQSATEFGLEPGAEGEGQAHCTPEAHSGLCLRVASCEAELARDLTHETADQAPINATGDPAIRCQTS